MPLLLPPGAPGADALQFWATQIEERLAALQGDGSGYKPGGDFRGALVTKAADQTGANYTAVPTYIAWDTEAYDTDAIHDTVTNNSRLTVPAGVTKVRLTGQVAVSNATASEWATLAIDKNGVTTAYAGHGSTKAVSSDASPRLNVRGPVVSVVPGDYFQLRLTIQTDASVDVLATYSWFAMEIIA